MDTTHDVIDISQQLEIQNKIWAQVQHQLHLLEECELQLPREFFSAMDDLCIPPAFKQASPEFVPNRT